MGRMGPANSAVARWRVRPRLGGMSDLTDQLRKQLTDGVEQLKGMRDELRLQVHLGGKELERAVKDLEPHIDEIERKAEQAGKDAFDAVRRGVDDLRTKLVDLRSRFGPK